MEKCIGLPFAKVFFIDNNIGIFWSKQDDTKKEPIVQLNDEHTYRLWIQNNYFILKPTLNEMRLN